MSTLTSIQYQTLFQPTVTGIRGAWTTRTSIWQTILESKSRKPTSYPTFISTVLGLRAGDINSLTYKDTLDDALNDISNLFTGDDADKSFRRRSAIAKSGICIYSESLVSIQGPPELLHRFHIIPRHIGHGSSVYTKLSDPSGAMQAENTDIRFLTIDTMTEEDNQPITKVFLRALLSENKNGGATFCYGVSHVKEHPSFDMIRPFVYAPHVLQALGNIACDKVTCEKTLSMTCTFVKEGRQAHTAVLERHSSSACCFWPRQNLFGMSDRLCRYDFHSCDPLHRFECAVKQLCFVRKDECQACCSRAALVTRDFWTTSGADGQVIVPCVHIIPVPITDSCC